MASTPVFSDSTEQTVDLIIERTGGKIVLGLPLGLGKPVQLVNALYQRAKTNREIQLHIVTALSLRKPAAKNPVEARFLDPFVQRLFRDYEDLDYAIDVDKKALPGNVKISEFFFLAGSKMGNPKAQMDYICTNYTHAPRDIFKMGVNVLAQQISKRKIGDNEAYSLSCNPEVTLGILEHFKQLPADQQPLKIGQVNRYLPFMVNDAEVPAGDFDIILSNESCNRSLFVTPHQKVGLADYAIGLHASALIPDGGTLQIGIGSLGDAIAHACILRHRRNDAYKDVLRHLKAEETWPELIRNEGGVEPFAEGLYGCSEMFVEGIMHLHSAGILKREVVQDRCLQSLLNRGEIGLEVTPKTLALLLQHRQIRPQLDEEQLDYLKAQGVFDEQVQWQDDSIVVSGQRIAPDLANKGNLDAVIEHCLGKRLRGCYLHAGFFLGSEIFYEAINDMSDEELAGINMTQINYINDLFGDSELKSLQRQKARFVNTCFLIQGLGASTADGIETGQVVSGVGGQYNFVAQAHEIPDARSIIMCRAVRHKDGVDSSNIVWNYGHTTIPRHLRDIYITEYGIADCRGKSDRDTVAALANICDTRFQEEFLSQAKAQGKIEGAYVVPERFRKNTPERLSRTLGHYCRHTKRDVLPDFPFGTELTSTELALVPVLTRMADLKASKFRMLRTALAGRRITPNKKTAQMLSRMDLENPIDFEDKMVKWLITALAQPRSVQ